MEKQTLHKDSKVLVHRFKIHYAQQLDVFRIELLCNINSTELFIYGNINPDMLTEGIQIHTVNPNNKKYNCRELYISKTDSEKLYDSVLKYIHNYADCLDNGIKVPKPLFVNLRRTNE